MVSATAFRVLGPLEVVVDGEAVALGGPKPRLLLATLLLQVNEAVSVDLLAEALWPGGTPRSAAANVRTYVHALRRVLAGSGADIERRPGGYALSAPPELVDLCLFETEVAAGTGADLERACARWRGMPLADLPPSPVWAPALTRLTELRLGAEERRHRLRAAGGDPDGAVAGLRALLGEHPLREELWRALVEVLLDAGRPVEAGRAYAEAEQILRDELDAAPGPALAALRDRLGAGTVCQLPLDVPDFTGRDDVVADLAARLRTARTRDTPVVVVLSGPPGVGKSAVAVRVAHAVRAEFPDGQLHVDLAGTSARPRPPADVLAELLRSLGAHAVPRQPRERAALLRSRLSRARMCVVLDDAASAAQVQPLLPGTGGCAVLVTSRTMLPDLTGAHPVALDVLDTAGATALLAGIAGPARVAADPAAAAAILRFCGYLPLAIRVAGTRLRHRPAWTLRTMADRLRDERRRLDELRVGDLAVRASVQLSYALLSPDAARALRWLALLGPGHRPGWVVAALLPGTAADDLVDVLVDAHLLEQTGTDAIGGPRYRLHDLVRVYAAEQAALDPEADQRAALARVTRAYLALAVTAADALPIHFLGVYATAAPPGPNLPGADPAADPVAWFEAERRAAVAAVVLAGDRGLDDLAWRLAAALTPYFDLRGHHDDWQRSHTAALAAARRAGDRHGEAVILRNLGQLALYRDEYAQARDSFTAAADLFGEAGDDRGAGFALAGLATVARIAGQHDLALDHCHRSLKKFAAAGDRHGEAVARLATGSVWLARDCLAPAGRWFTDALELAAAIGDRHREAHALRRIAVLHHRRGDLDTARAHTDRAAGIFAELRDDHCLGYTRQHLGELCLAAGDLPRARGLLEGALLRHRRSGDRSSEADVLELLGRLHTALGEVQTADDHHRLAARIRPSRRCWR